MKTVLEKFDHSPLWIRLGVLSIFIWDSDYRHGFCTGTG